MQNEPWNPRPVWRLFLFFLDFDDLSAFVVAAARADLVRKAHLTAVAALEHIGGFQGIVGAAAVAAAGRVLSFWLWRHDLTPVLDCCRTHCSQPGCGAPE
jgi:hypothetical protein